MGDQGPDGGGQPPARAGTSPAQVTLLTLPELRIRTRPSREKNSIQNLEEEPETSLKKKSDPYFTYSILYVQEVVTHFIW